MIQLDEEEMKTRSTANFSDLSYAIILYTLCKAFCLT